MIPKVEFEIIAGLYCEFLNFLTEKEFVIENIKPTDFGFTAVCFAKDYKKICKLSSKFQCKINLIKRKGLYFKLRPIICRKGIIIGCFILVFLLSFFNGVIWRIDINTGNNNIKEEILSFLYQNDIYVGNIYSREQAKLATQEMFLHFEDIGHVALNFSNGILSCEIEPRINKLNYLASSRDESIYSSSDGVITDLRVYKGFSQVKLRQFVSKGDILVAASAVNIRGETITTNPRAFIKAYCTKEYVAQVMLNKEELVYTGELQQDKTIKFLGKDIHYKNAHIGDWQNFQKTTQFEYLKILGFHLPFTVEKTTYYRQEYMNIYNDEQKAQRIAENIISKEIEEDLSLLEIEKTEYKLQTAPDSIIVTCVLVGYYDITK